MKLVQGRTRLSASDLSNYLACRHLSTLDKQTAAGELAPSKAFDIGFQKLVERGEAHELAVYERLRASGHDVIEIDSRPGSDATSATRDALASGVSIIFQGVLESPPQGAPLYGRPDFLIRSEVMRELTGSARPAGPGYEIVDAKLARTAKARAVLQMAFYSALLAVAQDAVPEEMHLALGNGELSTFRVADFASYERRTRSMLQEFIEAAGPVDTTYPEPVEHCSICRWSDDCSSRRRADDDLSLVAGMPTQQRLALKAVGIATRRGFAQLEQVPVLGRMSPSSLARSQLQARLQVASEDARRIEYELLEPETDAEGALVPNRGLLALPPPAEGDLFFDIEGARHYSEDNKEFGLQYLFGMVDTSEHGEDGRPTYTPVWAFDRAGEKDAFEQVIDFITERRTRHPNLHVYHYNHYETTSIDHLTSLHETHEEAVGRLTGRFATHEDDVDDLFRLGVFVDLYRVVRQGVRVGVESYSIKRLEPLIGFERQVDLHDATTHLITFESDLDAGTAGHDLESQDGVAGYNEDDCRSTLVLRDWLEGCRRELELSRGVELPRPTYQEEAHDLEDPDIARLKAELRWPPPTGTDPSDDEVAARVLLADLLEWHRREAKPGWWQYFRRTRMTSTELVDDRSSIGELVGGEIVDHVKKSVVRRFGFPAQEHGFDVGDGGFDPVGKKSWTVHALDQERGTIDLRIGVASDASLPSAIVGTGPVNTTVLARSLREMGERVVRDGLGGADTGIALLLRRPPFHDVALGSTLQHDDEALGDATIRLVQGLRASYLPIQGPPGSGKTYVGADAILSLLAAGRTVGITAPSHAVIHNMLDEVVRHAAEQRVTLRIAQRPDPASHFLHESATSLDYKQIRQGLDDKAFNLVAGTVWLWAREEFSRAVDVLVVDEAGQLSLASTLAAAQGATNLVLLGDPQQLAQPSAAAQPPGAEVSALEHILGDRSTMPDGAGLFFDRTYRMHPNLCEYTSDVFYDSRLHGVEGLDHQRIDGMGDWTMPSGLHVIEVVHRGNTNASPEEAAEVARLVERLLSGSWTNRDDAVAPMTADDVMVVTPYNAQIREINQALRRAGVSGVRVGTVDKFQGREAPAVIYSMATSSAADAPRGLEFLFDLHRLNVATSRARALGVIVASPDLARVFCRTPRQMQLANALCAAWER